MRRVLAATLALTAVAACAVPAAASARHHRHGPQGVAGTVVTSTCAAASCPVPLTAGQPDAGTGLTVTVRRVSDGTQVASVKPIDPSFRIRTRPGTYDVTASVPGSNPCGPTPVAARIVCPTASSPIVAPCGPVSDTARVKVRRHRFTWIQLQLPNIACIATPQ